jgi:hypothetical protein
MFDGSVYLNNLTQMFEYLPVLRYAHSTRVHELNIFPSGRHPTKIAVFAPLHLLDLQSVAALG